MEAKLRELLDKIYELEGLVHLALKRDDSSKDFIRLITKKGKEIGEISSSVKGNTKDDIEENQPEKTTFSIDEYSIDEYSDTNPLIPELEQREKIDNEKNKGEVEPEHQRGKLVFSINERFRYRKELFDNSDADFNNTLALVASMENYEEAEDYFINEEGFDPRNPIVMEFMEVIKRYFK